MTFLMEQPGLGAYAKQDEPYILTLNDEGKLHEAMRQANLESANTNLDSNPAGGPYGDKYLVMVPYGQAPMAGSAGGGPFQILRARGSIAAAASQGQYVLGSEGKWFVSVTPTVGKAAGPLGKYAVPLALAGVAVIGAIVMFGRKRR